MVYLIVVALSIAIILLTAKVILLKKEFRKVAARLSKEDDRALMVLIVT